MEKYTKNAQLTTFTTSQIHVKQRRPAEMTLLLACRQTFHSQNIDCAFEQLKNQIWLDLHQTDISHHSPSVGAVFEPQSEWLVPPTHKHKPCVIGRPECLWTRVECIIHLHWYFSKNNNSELTIKSLFSNLNGFYQLDKYLHILSAYRKRKSAMKIVQNISESIFPVFIHIYIAECVNVFFFF